MSDHALKFVARTVDGAEHRFAKLTARDRADVLRRLKEADKNDLRANMREAEFPREQFCAELVAFDRAKYGEAHFAGYANTPDGKVDLAGLAYRKANPAATAEAAAAAVDAVDLSDGGLLPLVCEVANLQMAASPPPAGGGEGDDDADGGGGGGDGADPLRGAAYGK